MAKMKTLTVSGQTYTVSDPEAVHSIDGCLPDETGNIRVVDNSRAGAQCWSGKHIVERLCPPFSETAPLAICTPVAGYPLEVVSKIPPVQSGTGNPSPDNIRPITGHTAVKLTRCGKNLLDITKGENSAASVNGDTIRVTKSASGGRSSGSIPLNIPANTNFTVSGKLLDTNGTTTNPWTFFCITESGKYHGVNHSNVSADGSFRWSRTFTEAIIRCYIQIEMGEEAGVYAEFTDLQIEFGGKTNYEPYRGETFTFPLGQAVYGGSLDWNSGVLTITDKGVALKDLQWEKMASGQNGHYAAKLADGKQGGTLGQPMLCNMFTQATANSDVYPGIHQGQNSKIVVGSQDMYGDCRVCVGGGLYPTLADFKTALADNDGLLVYLLKEPITVQLTAQEVLALSGENILYSDTGDTEVTGRADPVAIIEKITNAIVALGGNV